MSDEEGKPRFELRLALRPKGGQVAAMLGIRRNGAPGLTFAPGRATEHVGMLLRDGNNRQPGLSGAATRKLLAIGRMAPVFSVDTGTSPAAIPAGLEAFLETLP